MAVLYPHFLASLLRVHKALEQQIPYPFFDPACVLYEAIRAVEVECLPLDQALDRFELTDYGYQKGHEAFTQHGVAGLIGQDSRHLTQALPVEVERKVFVLKAARSEIPATKMALLLTGFGIEVSVRLMRHLYASYGWAQGIKAYKHVDFLALNRKVARLSELQATPLSRTAFFEPHDPLQSLLEVFRTLGQAGITKRFPGSRVTFEHYKKAFLSLGLLGLIERARPAFRNSKMGFQEEGLMILSKIQHPERSAAYYQSRLLTKKIRVDRTALSKIFSRWEVDRFQSPFPGELKRWLQSPENGEPTESRSAPFRDPPSVPPLRLDQGFITFFQDLTQHPVPLANPGLFLFLPYLNRLQILEKTATLLDVDPEQCYSWFTLLLLAIARITGGLSSLSKVCHTAELSFPLSAGLVEMPCADTLLNGLAAIDEAALFELRRYLTHIALQVGLIKGKRIAFDFHMRDFTSDEVALKQIGKAPSPKRHICFPGFRPHLAWDVETGAPITLEFRKGRARATTTLKRFFQDLLHPSLGPQGIERVYLDSEYTAEHIWKFVVDPHEGLGAHLSMCVKQNKRVKQYVDAFLKTAPTWLYYDEQHTYTEQTFELPIQDTSKRLQCVLKRHDKTGRLRCFGSTLEDLDSKGILEEYTHRWVIENGIKDLVGNYCFDQIPGIDPHRINLHFFVVTLVRLLFEMLAHDYEAASNPDGTQKSIGTLRPEFLTGVNGLLSRQANQLTLTWQDPYPEKQHQALTRLFAKLNQEAQDGLRFLGGIRLAFDITAPRRQDFHNQRKRVRLEI